MMKATTHTPGEKDVFYKDAPTATQLTVACPALGAFPHISAPFRRGFFWMISVFLHSGQPSLHAVLLRLILVRKTPAKFPLCSVPFGLEGRLLLAA
jgi:hypothetical protein